ncbi:MAG TPA: DUF2058 family protein [Thioalkalivibrio sp.]|nr:DUF2058 family protein [Thioalkalivibrio sp.]
MGDLKEQLLKAGLVTEEQVREAARPAKPASRRGKPGKGRAKTKGKAPREGNRSHQTPAAGVTPEEIDLARAYRLRAEEERRAREAAEQARREAERLRRANRARIAELIREHAQNDASAEQSYHFTVGDKVKQVLVTPEQLQALADGLLAITFLDGRRCLIPAAVADEIQALDPGKLVIRHTPETDGAAADDVPDDLVW